MLVSEFLDGGSGLWLAPGGGVAPEEGAVVATSGSTGEAKNVVLHRDALIAAARAAQERLGYSATWHLALSPEYVAGLMVLVRGLLGDGVRTAASDLTDVEPAPGRNCLSIVGTQLYRALESREITSRLALFDAVLVGGAVLRPELRAQAEGAGIPVIETYGMSETCGGVVWDGVPLPGVKIVLGELGRVEIGGPMLFDGYLGASVARGEADGPSLRHDWRLRHGVGSAHATGRREPAQTPAGRFVTNDRGRWDGAKLIIDGRMDDVVISGGVNVDLAAVRRAVLALEPEAEVLAVEDSEWGARIVVFAPRGSLAEWRERLRPQLPPAALPRQLVTVAKLPRTAGGKPERKSLLELVQP